MSRAPHGGHQSHGKYNIDPNIEATPPQKKSLPALADIGSGRHQRQQSEPARSGMGALVSLERNYTTTPPQASEQLSRRGVGNVMTPMLYTKSVSSKVGASESGEAPPEAPIRVLVATGPVKDYGFSPVVKLEKLSNNSALKNDPSFVYPFASSGGSRSKGVPTPQTNQQRRSISQNNSNDAIFTGMGSSKNQHDTQHLSVPLISASTVGCTQQQVPRDVMCATGPLPLNGKDEHVFAAKKKLAPTMDNHSDQFDTPGNRVTSKSSTSTTPLHTLQYPSGVKREGGTSLPPQRNIPNHHTPLHGVPPLPLNTAHISTTTLTRTIRKVKYVPVGEENIESSEDENEPIDMVEPPMTTDSSTRSGGNAWRTFSSQSSRAPQSHGDNQLIPCRGGEYGISMHTASSRSPVTSSGFSTLGILSSNKWARRCYMVSPIQVSSGTYPALAPMVEPKDMSASSGAQFLLQRHHQCVEVGRPKCR